MRLRGLALLSALLAFPAHAQLNNVLHQERSLYRNIFVTQDGDERCMMFRVKHGVGRESCKYLSRPDVHVFDYTQMMMAGLFLNPQPKRILIIGLGGGTMAATLQKMVPTAQIDNVELDQSVADIARDYFGFRTNDRVHLFVEDGRVFVKRRMRLPAKYDMVMLDAFDGEYIPEHMLTQEYLREVRSIMTPTGVIVANTFSTGDLYPHESVTYRSVFGPFYNMKAANRVIVARLGPRLPAAEIRRNAMSFGPALTRIGTSPDALIKLMSAGTDWDPKAAVLTDQYSPSNVLNASNAGR